MSDCEFLFKDPRRLACRLSRETSRRNLPLTYWSGMAIGVSPANKMLLCWVQFPTEWLNRETKAWVLFYGLLFSSDPQCSDVTARHVWRQEIGNVTFVDRIFSIYVYVYIVILPLLTLLLHATASAADQDEITLRWFMKSRAGKWCCFLAPRSKLFVDIKERKRLDMSISIHYPTESNNPLDIWNNWNMKKDNVYTDSEYRMCSSLYPHRRNKYFPFFFLCLILSYEEGKGPLRTSL